MSRPSRTQPDTRSIIPNWHSLTPVAYFAALAILVLGALLVPTGYILSLDTVWGPHFNFDPDGSGISFTRALVWVTLFLLRAITGPELAQSIYVFGIVVAIGWAMYATMPSRSRLVKYFAGTFYLLNPFVYDRLVSGQWLFLLGYALLPLAFRELCRLMRHPDWRRGALVALWWSGLTIASYHFVFIFGLLFLAGWGIALLAAPHRGRTFLAWASVLGWYALFNCYWIIPAVSSVAAFGYVDQTHTYTFATHADVFGNVWASVLWLQGFFGQKGVQLAVENPLIAALFLPLIGLAVYGAVIAVRRPAWRDPTVALTIAAYLAIVLAVGVGSAGSRPVYLWLFEHVPGFAAMREPQKFVALLCLFYALFAGFGLSVLLERLARTWQRILLVLAATALVVLQVLPMLGGLSGQLHRTDYPIGWYRARDITNELPNGTILVLPWQQYLKLPFAYSDKVVLNPVPAVFDRDARVSRRIDVAGAAEPPDRPIDTVADKLDHGQHINAYDMKVLQAYAVEWIVVLNPPRHSSSLARLATDPRFSVRYRDSSIMLLKVHPDR